jgi:Tol biopolymer transport system component/DNA-binding winged helix-turn-helix (wHTH) protein
MPPVGSSQAIRFATFEVDLQAQELRKAGLRLKLTGQPFQVLAALLENPGKVVTREELQERIWPDSFVDFDHNLNTAINKIREALGDSAESPRYVETLPRRGYRFIAPVEALREPPAPSPTPQAALDSPPKSKTRVLVSLGIVAALLLVGLFFGFRRKSPIAPAQRSLTRLTFDDGLQIGATWSPDGRYIAYASDRGGKFDVWLQQVTGGDAIQVTTGPGQHWQPDWSPDGKYLAYRSDGDQDGLFVVPALGGTGLARRVSTFGYYPRWSPDGSQILFRTSPFPEGNRIFVVGLNGAAPREVLDKLLDSIVTTPIPAVSGAWHPDGKRVSVWCWKNWPTPVPNFWTAPVDGGPAIETTIGADLLKQMGAVAAGTVFFEWAQDFKFSWTASGNAIYFERTLRGVRNVWKLSVAPRTLQAISIERVTTGVAFDSQPALSPDGHKLIFTGENRQIRAWLYLFDGTRGQILDSGRGLTSAGLEGWLSSLSPDGKTLAFYGKRAGAWQFWETSVADGRESPAVPDDTLGGADEPKWSPDGSSLAYARDRLFDRKIRIVAFNRQTRTEEQIASCAADCSVFDWSRDGSLWISRANPQNARYEILRLPISARPHAETAATRIASDPASDLWQSQLSPDGRWITFEAATPHATHFESTLHVVSAKGGPWIRLTDGKQWDDKPRWSADGKTIYFISERGGFLNVWGLRFDPVKGAVHGEPFRVTSFNRPSLMIPKDISLVSLSVAQDRLVVTLAQTSGSIWLLDNVDR